MRVDCVRALALNNVGLPWSLKPRTEEETPFSTLSTSMNYARIVQDPQCIPSISLAVGYLFTSACVCAHLFSRQPKP